jgi:hypothetical protein
MALYQMTHSIDTLREPLGNLLRLTMPPELTNTILLVITR